MLRIEIDEQGCRGCRMCLDVCPTEVFVFDDAAATARVARAEDCIACLSCGYLCPSGAIRHSDHPEVKNFYRELDYVRRLDRFL